MLNKNVESTSTLATSGKIFGSSIPKQTFCDLTQKKEPLEWNKDQIQPLQIREHCEYERKKDSNLGNVEITKKEEEHLRNEADSAVTFLVFVLN